MKSTFLPLRAGVPASLLPAALLLASLLCVAPGHAQTDTTQVVRNRLLQRLAPGTTVRVLIGGEAVTGRLASVSADTLYLDVGAVSTTDITAAWFQQRSTRKGLKIGAIVGAPAGAAFGLFVIWLASALCESGCSDYDAGTYVLGTLGFSAAGLVAGGTLGAVIGAAIPRWVEITDRARLPTGDARAATRSIGSVSLTPVATRATGNHDVGFGARGSYMFQTPHVALGLEAGKYGLGSATHEIFRVCGNRTDLCPDTVAFDRDVFHAGGIARFGTGASQRIEPYASLGLGLYSWGSGPLGSIQLGGYSAGAGLHVRNDTGRRGAFAEVRWQSNLTRSGDPDPQYGFYTFGLGGSLTW